MQIPEVIAIDGPAGSGKSTLGRKLADYLDYLFFDTGVMYRAIACAAIMRGIPTDDEAGITRLAERVKIDVLPPSQNDGRDNDLLVDGEDITWKIRTPEVEASVSEVAAYPGVRSALTIQQRRIGKRGRIVMVGRDIGTVVLPDADLKLYLDASVEERARRRHEERVSRGEAADYQVILEAMKQRDETDSTREVAPLRPAEDAVILDSDGLDAEQVLERVQRLLATK